MLEVNYGRGYYVRTVSNAHYDVVRYLRNKETAIVSPVIIARIERDIFSTDDHKATNDFVIVGHSKRFSALAHAVNELRGISFRQVKTDLETYVNADAPIAGQFTSEDLNASANAYNERMTKNARKRAERARLAVAKAQAEALALEEQNRLREEELARKNAENRLHVLPTANVA